MTIMQMFLGIGAPVGGIQATGGDQIVQPGNGYVYHTFTTPGPGTFTVSAGSLAGGTVELFMVGGGGTGNRFGGGGGGGALIYKTGAPVAAQGYPVVIGAGGGSTGATFSGPGGPYPGGEGVDSTALGYTAAGGGHGGVSNMSGWHADPGGSGGGGAPRNPQYPPGNYGNAGTGSGDTGGSGGSVSPNNGWGNDGAVGSPSNANGGGGGGAGSVGNSVPGLGGSGLAYPDFAGPLLNVPTIPGTYAAGGPKGQSGPHSYPLGVIDNTGSGGGDYSNPSLYGRPGIVVIRYLE